MATSSLTLLAGSAPCRCQMRQGSVELVGAGTVRCGKLSGVSGTVLATSPRRRRNDAGAPGCSGSDQCVTVHRDNEPQGVAGGGKG